MFDSVSVAATFKDTLAGQLPQQVQQAVVMVPGVAAVVVALVWDPPWTADRMSDEAKLELGLL